jgi:hypothetical protein
MISKIPRQGNGQKIKRRFGEPAFYYYTLIVSPGLTEHILPPAKNCSVNSINLG